MLNNKSSITAIFGGGLHQIFPKSARTVTTQDIIGAERFALFARFF